jgi:choloylglycine hydrolase
MIKRSATLAFLMIGAGLCNQAVEACTGIVLNKAKGLVITGRTLDYNSEMGSNICFKGKGTRIVDSGVKYTNLTGPAYSWTSKFNVVLVDAFNEPAYVDGMNSAGLSVATLWQDDTQPARNVVPGTSGLSNTSLVEYLLENAANIAEARRLASGLSLVIAVYKGQPMPLHWIVTDRTGESLVIELKDGRPKFFKEATDVAVLANSPTYDRQLANLKTNKHSQQVNRAYVLPGDYQSTSRFVRSAFLVSHLPAIKTAGEGMAAATQILHNVESPKGAQSSGSYTQWLAVRDQTNLRYWLTGVNHPVTKLVDLRTIDFKEFSGKRIPVDSADGGDVAALRANFTAQSAKREPTTR